MTTTKLAVVCDDHGGRVEDWRETVSEKLGDEWDVQTIGGPRLVSLVTTLSDVEVAFRAGRNYSDFIDDDQKDLLALLDRCDLVIFDSDLSPNLEDTERIGEEGSRSLRNQMGDAVARQIRSYTSAGYIVVVNMYWGNYPADRVFDLTMMQGARSHADLHISDDELESEALWFGDSAPDDDYRPWNWPVLATANQIVERSIAAIGDLDEDVFAALSLDPKEFSPRQLDTLGTPRPTFRSLAESELGFRYGALGHDDEAIRRMAASVLRRWSLRYLLAAQNVVSDAPHLLTRFSPILGEREPSVDVWNSAADSSHRPVDQLIGAEPARLERLEAFLDRPVYSVPVMRELVAGLEPLWLDPPNLLLAEDTTTFLPENQLVGFDSDLPGNYSRRFVRQLDGVDYEPSPRLLL